MNPAWSMPRMPDGHPDMQGVWANNGMTPLEATPAVWGNPRDDDGRGTG